MENLLSIFEDGAAMYAQFTDRARKVMELGNQEAQRFNHEYLGTEHVLLGLVKEGSGVASNVLKNLGIDLHNVRLELEKIVQSDETVVPMTPLPMTPRAKKVIEYALEEARSLKHLYVGTEHLLLGLVREDAGVAAQILMNLGLRLQVVRQEVLNILGHHQDLEEADRTLDLAEAPEDSNAEIQHLPEHAREIVAEFDCQIDVIDQEKEEAVAAQEFEKAFGLLSLEDKLKKLRADFIRQWLRDS